MLRGVAVLWGGQCQVGTAATAQCSQLQSRGSSSLFCPLPLSLLAKDFPKLHLVSTSHFSVCLGRRLALTALGREVGDCQARVSDC